MIFTEEQIHAAARAVERAANPQWDDDQFEIWWNHDPFFTSKITSWGHFIGTRKEKRIDDTRIALETIQVKPLVWNEYDYVQTPFGSYSVSEDVDDTWHWTFHCYPYGTADETPYYSKEQACDAAFTDYVGKIVSTLGLSE